MKEEIKDAFRAELHSRWKDRLKQVEQEEAKVVRIRRFPAWSWAVGLALLVGLSAWLFMQIKPEDTAQIALNYFEPMPNTLAPTIRGTVPTESLAKALYWYDTGQYAKASEALSAQQIPEEADIYLGVSYLAQSRLAEAIETLENSTAPAAQWYLALAYLQQQETEKGVALLKEIERSEGHSFSAKASSLLRDL